jgi:hypothetical protein
VKDAADAEANELEGVAVGKACGDEQDAAGEAVGLQLRHEGDGGLIAEVVVEDKDVDGVMGEQLQRFSG